MVVVVVGVVGVVVVVVVVVVAVVVVVVVSGSSGTSGGSTKCSAPSVAMSLLAVTGSDASRQRSQPATAPADAVGGAQQCLMSGGIA